MLAQARNSRLSEILQAGADEGSLKRDYGRSQLMQFACISLETRSSEIPQHNLFFENFVILSPVLVDSFTALNPSMSSD